ncbi:hypothetical protein [Aquimarina mytili]|uniref:SMI1/KNR4 family protein n=1 Tax=Aquimarina mytili TaxID=874423 RepID=A0A936ZVM4_9FLAO|nr:hypothetical protein [Aquimarina mytili]MBL0682748.1 hypothetical protein [Aquimarina mytili]
MKDVRKHIEKNFKVILPERLKNFYDNKEYKQYHGLCAHSLMYYQSDLKFEVKFDDKRAFEEAYIELYGDTQYVTNIEGKIPLTQLGEEYKFLFVDILTPKLEVFQLEASECKFYLYKNSFDLFLESLV